MRVLTFTRLWPNAVMPNHGVFIEERMRRVAALRGISLTAVAPVPWFPRLPGPSRWSQFSNVPRQEIRHGIHVEHPRYPLIPKLSQKLHGRSIAAASWSTVARLHRQQPFDLIDSHFLHPDGFAAVEIGKRLGVPVVLSARGSDAQGHADDPAMQRLLRPTLAAASMLIAVSRPLAERLVELGAPPEKIAIVPNGIDASTFRPNPGAGEAVRKHVGCGPGERLIVSVGRLERVKGHDMLLAALAILSRAVRVRAVIVGEGSWRRELEDQAEALGLGDRVLFAGSIPHDALSAWYSAADVFCLPSRSEGHPNALVEALACGTPAVSTAVGAAGEILSQETGLLVPAEDSAALATALAAALTRNWDRTRIRSRVSGRSWERVADSVRSVFEEALRVHAAGAARPRVANEHALTPVAAPQKALQ